MLDAKKDSYAGKLRWYEANEMLSSGPLARVWASSCEVTGLPPASSAVVEASCSVEHAHNSVSMVNAAVMLSLVAIKIDSSMTRQSGFWCNKTLDTRKVL